MVYEAIILEKEAGVATITLNRPQVLNALDRQLAADFSRAVDDVMGDSDIRVIIITGAGRGFCSGADLSMFEEQASGSSRLMNLGGADPRDIIRHNTMLGATLKLREMDKPVVAAINGPAVGGGIALALAADIRIASEKASFALPFSRRGLVPDGGTSWLITRVVGLARAYELALTGRTVDAEEAFRIGIVNRVVPHKDLMKESRALASDIAQGPPIAIQLTKNAIRSSLATELSSHMLYELYLNGLLENTNEFRERLAVFLEKRSPVFKGE